MNNPSKPEIYQGFRQTSHYFEGWYFKHVSADARHSLACIPGVSLSKKDPHAFVQVFLAEHGDEPSLKTYYIRYPLNAFKPQKDIFDVWVGPNHFTSSFIALDLHDEDLDLSGMLTYDGLTPLNKGFLNPSIMGPFAYAPAMECYHGIVSLDHRIKGVLQYGNKQLDFQHGKGYIEKDWGRSFPENYVWIHANHFERDHVSFFFSYAKIPYLGLRFQGLICHLYLAGKHLRFATYNGAKVKREVVRKNNVYYEIRRGSLQLNIEANIDRVVDLPSPKNGTMDHVIKEGLSGTVAITLTRGKTVLFEGTSTTAGIEIMKS